MSSAISFPEYLYAINTWCTPKNTWLLDIEQSAAVGALAVGLWESKFRDDEDEAVLAALEKHGLRAGIVMPHHWTILPTPLDPGGIAIGWEKKCEGICEAIRRFAKFKPVGLMVGPGVSGDASKRLGPVEHVAKGLAMVADAAAEHGMTIAFEPLALRRGAAVATLPETIALLDSVGRDNVKILLDVWHSWPEDNLHAHIRKHIDRFIGVQINDVRPNERSWCDRVFPGEGRNICTPIVATLIDAGFKGWYDFEVFSDDGRWGNDFPESLWKMSHAKFLDHGQRAFAKCYADAKAMVAAGQAPR
ncbi:MAG: sugar phosphate isomerase/epimerase family protein [Burkholderiales bacterium]